MIGLLQRVSEASVTIEGRVTGRIDRGLLVLIGVERGDEELQAKRLLERLLKYRVFDDERGRMNHGLDEVGGGLLLVPQFTLAAQTHQGTRPGFSGAAAAPIAGRLFEYLVAVARERHPIVHAGKLGATMQVRLTNDGPVTFWLRVAPVSDNVFGANGFGV